MKRFFFFPQLIQLLLLSPALSPDILIAASQTSEKIPQEQVEKITNRAKQIGKEMGKGFAEELTKNLEQVPVEEKINELFGKLLTDKADELNGKFRFYAVTSALMIGAIVLGVHSLKHISSRWLTTPGLENYRGDSAVMHFLKKKLLRHKAPSYRDMILNPDTLRGIEKYLAALTRSAEAGGELPSLLLYGPPGSGKTEIVRRIIQEYNFDGILISGSSFMQYDDGRGVTELNRLFDRAEQGGFLKRKLIIFIDEAEIFLGKRGRPNNSKSDILLNHFLSRTGTRSRHYSIISASNRPDALDDAVSRRLLYHTEVPLPDAEERSRLFRFYLESILQKERRILITEPLSDTFYHELAERSDKLSGADIMDIAYMSMNQAYSHDMKLNHNIVFDSIIDVTKKTTKKVSFVSEASTETATEFSQ